MNDNESNAVITELAQAAKAGKQNATNRLYLAMQGRARDFIWSQQARMRLNGHDCEDVLQELYFELPRLVKKWRPDRPFVSFVCSSIRYIVKRMRGRVPTMAALESRDGTRRLDPEDRPAYEQPRSMVVVEKLLERAPHADLVAAYYGIGATVSLGIDEISATRRLSQKRVRECIHVALAHIAKRAPEAMAAYAA